MIRSLGALYFHKMGVYLSNMDTEPSKAQSFRVGMVLVDGFSLMSYSSAIEPLRAANLLSGQELYKVRNLPVFGARSISSTGAVVPATAHIGEQVDFDLVLVIASGNPFAFDDANALSWLRNMARRNVIIGGVSGGPVILAKAGIMKGRRMTVHWEHRGSLAERYPDLQLDHALYVVDKDRLTCAGGTAPLDMMHALISSHHGSDFARSVSDWYLHTDVRPAGGPQRAGLAQRYHTNNASVLRVIETMENQLSDPLSLSELASIAGLGVRQLNRLFQSKLNMTTMVFYRKLRLDKANTLLAQSYLSVTEVALATGFASTAHFSTCYKKHFGLAPSLNRG